MNFQFPPIGYFSSNRTEKYMVAKQAELTLNCKGVIHLNEGQNFEQALDDLEGFSRIWVIYCFHRNSTWKPKVMTPRGAPKRGVFATRSPHRPNPIGISCVELLRVSGLHLYIGNNDLLDKTPVIDIKPYITYADSFPDAHQGWLEMGEESEPFEIEWSTRALNQARFIEDKTQMEFISTVELRLCSNPFPFPGHRIRECPNGEWELALRTWRVIYAIAKQKVTILDIHSGYDLETLEGRKESKWDDVPLHQEFLKLSF